jgi:hypothetical protein
MIIGKSWLSHKFIMLNKVCTFMQLINTLVVLHSRTWASKEVKKGITTKSIPMIIRSSISSYVRPSRITALNVHDKGIVKCSINKILRSQLR